MHVYEAAHWSSNVVEQLVGEAETVLVRDPQSAAVSLGHQLAQLVAVAAALCSDDLVAQVFDVTGSEIRRHAAEHCHGGRRFGDVGGVVCRYAAFEQVRSVDGGESSRRPLEYCLLHICARQFGVTDVAERCHLLAERRNVGAIPGRRFGRVAHGPIKGLPDDLGHVPNWQPDKASAALEGQAVLCEWRRQAGP